MWTGRGSVIISKTHNLFWKSKQRNAYSESLVEVGRVAKYMEESDFKRFVIRMYVIQLFDNALPHVSCNTSISVSGCGSRETEKFKFAFRTKISKVLAMHIFCLLFWFLLEILMI